MLSGNPNSLLKLPQLRHFMQFDYPSLDDSCTFLIVQFERPTRPHHDQYYFAILRADADVSTTDPAAVFDAALAWDYAETPLALAPKIAAWLGEYQ